MIYSFRYLCVLNSFLIFTLAFVSPVHADDRIDVATYQVPHEVFDGQAVVLIQTSTQEQLDALLEVAESVWSERTGVGVLELQIQREYFALLDELEIPFEVLIEDLRAYAEQNWGQVVQAERTYQETLRRGGEPGIHEDEWFSNYRQLGEIEDYVTNLADQRPDIAAVQIIGESIEGREMLSVIVSGPDSVENPRSERPVVYIFSTVHAREWIAPMTTVYIASKLIEDYESNQRVRHLLDHIRVAIVPVGNPDGYVHSWTTYRYWRKNRRENADGRFGVDINRNWGYEWGGPGSSSSTGSNTYRGESPFSEPETRALRDFALSFGDDLRAHIDYHSYSQLVMYPWGYTNDPVSGTDHEYFDRLAIDVANEIGEVHETVYDPIQLSELYRAAGNSTDWFYGDQDRTSMTIELRPANNDFDPHPDNILPNAEENYNGFLRYLERVIEPVSIWHEVWWNYLLADTEWNVSAAVLSRNESVQIESVRLHSRINEQDEFLSQEMTDNQNGVYFAQLPPTPCGAEVQYYFDVTLSSGEVYTSLVGTQTDPYTDHAVTTVTATRDHFEVDTGWVVGSPLDSATAGIWERVDPDQVSAQDGTVTQPDDDETFFGSLCFVTDGQGYPDSNDGDVDGGRTTITSPTFNASIGQYASVNFRYWLSTTGSWEDGLSAQLSFDDGLNWVEIGGWGPTDGEWRDAWIPTYFYDEIPSDQMRVRFIATDDPSNGDDTVEVAIDNYRVEFFGCPTANPADFNNDSVLSFEDVQAYIYAFTARNPESDILPDGALNYLDIAEFMREFSLGLP